MRAKLLKFFVILGIVGRIGPAVAANIAPGEAYQDLREQLLADGWKPETSYGLKLANGKPYHRYPEVLCGLEKCRAKWHDRSGAERAIMLERGGPSDPYRVISAE
ncbi:hypothetical protein K9U39_13310 [Rhodoblastus acidophilus]|uniref:Uncharacterized protein n=1 Tax=Candidatus Rhodoblastus alkanivorans TaxID=2954117 RepID=A0ABS9ZAF4_9HYPH|nr:hypothetical protein [Candidatus Rhodoblastus alkanivorans]MCI4677236.1 hypothetical protein [Candidatus Rhodoblastus alkanivorans]MCI4684588.1 hypothetical protein [Candidatus Rhodoblastus alkanivorans]MDI4641910.1 hypothetical protein [Rhodoblastus acidophilus]